MKCSQKNGFVYFWLLISVISIEGESSTWSLKDNSLRGNRMDFVQFLVTKKILDDLEPFPALETKNHKIVKKQMTVSDYPLRKLLKRSIFTPPKRSSDSGNDDSKCKGDEDAMKEIKENEAINSGSIKTQGSNSAKSAQLTCKLFTEKIKRSSGILIKREKVKKSKSTSASCDRPENKPKQGFKNLEGCPCNRYNRYPDNSDCHYFFECEVEPDGCLKLKRKKCPEGEIFSPLYLECLNTKYLQVIQRTKRLTAHGYSKKIEIPETPPDLDVEPANEWLDASKSGGNKIPSEFKPKKKPMLKIYHLRSKRKPEQSLKEKPKKRNAMRVSAPEAQRKTTLASKGTVEHQNFRHQHPRSFLIKVNKKEGKNREQSITENNENENEDDEENEEEEDDEEGEDEEDEETEEDEENKNHSEKPNRKEVLKDFFKSAKSAVINKVKFDEGSLSYNNNAEKSDIIGDKTPKLEKTETTASASDKSKKVLIDANIRVDSALSSALRNILSKRKDENFGENKTTDEDKTETVEENQQEIDPTSLKRYENLLKSNPRVKRYFLTQARA